MSANYTPNQNEYKNLTPFKTWLLLQINTWGLTNFPFVESDFDELTNYGMMQKLMGAVNDVISNENEVEQDMTNLFNAFTELQSYINNYFDNLDVDDEINAKLDAMVEDGSLESLIGAYIQPRIDAQNQRITQVENMVESATSGSPLVATSTAGMTDTTRVYVNTTDGNWYYYDGDSWEIGGVYQGINLNNKAVHYQNLDDELQDSIDSVESTTNYNTLTSGFINTNGTITSSTILGRYEIPVQYGESYYLKIWYTNTTWQDTNATWVFLNNNDEVVSYGTKTDVTIDSNGMYEKYVEVPYTATKMVINTHLRTTGISKSCIINKITKYTINNIKKEQFDSKIQSFFNNIYEEITPTQFIDNAYIDLNVIRPYATSEILSYEVEPGDECIISGTQVANNPYVFFTTNNIVVPVTINDNTYQVHGFNEYIKEFDSSGEYENYAFTIPKYCDKIYVNAWKTGHNRPVVKKATSYKIKSSDVIVDTTKVGFNKLIAIGDSITEVNYRALTNYLGWIKNDIPTLTIQNLGVSGTGYMRTSNTFINRINSIQSYDIENDVVIVMGSVNDMSYVENQLGSLGDTTTDTLYGSMYQFFNTLFTKFNGVRVGCISPINWKYSGNSKQNLTLYIKALKETCELFNVPFLDIHQMTNLRPENATFLTEYYTADGVGNTGQVDTSGVHPNSDGHHLFYGRIKEFICKL